MKKKPNRKTAALQHRNAAALMNPSTGELKCFLPQTSILQPQTLATPQHCSTLKG